MGEIRITEREKKAARKEFEKLDALADKALRVRINEYVVDDEKAMKRLEARLSRLNLRKLIAIRNTAEQHFKCFATHQLVQRKICEKIDAINDTETLEELLAYAKQFRLYNYGTQDWIKRRIQILKENAQ